MVQNGVVRSAVTDVTSDGMRELVFVACEQLGIQLECQPPILTHARWWEGAFIASCTHGLRPIKALRLPRDLCPNLRDTSIDTEATAAGPADSGSMLFRLQSSLDAVELMWRIAEFVQNAVANPSPQHCVTLMEVAKPPSAPVQPKGLFAASVRNAASKRSVDDAGEIDADALAAAASVGSVGAAPSDKPATQKVAGMLHSRMRVTLTDKRIIVGNFVCFDQQRNLILSESEELSFATEDVDTGDQGCRRRMLGLIMVPGRHLVKCEVETPV